MAPGYGDAETISANVQTAAVIYASGTSEEIGIAGKRNAEDTDWMERRSRGYTFDDDGDIFPDNINFNRADHGPESSQTDFALKWIFGTHSAIGGAAWNGDDPPGHSDLNDRDKAAESDQYIRIEAGLSGVPINEVNDYGYEWLGDPEEDPRE